MYLFADYHTHTRYSHGRGTVRDNVKAALVKGLEEIAISDHGPAHMFGIGMESVSVLDRIRQDATSAMEKHPGIKVLVGIESNVISVDGTLDLPPQFREKVDVMQAGLHLMVRPSSWIAGLLFYSLHYFRWLGAPIRSRSRIANTEAVVNAVYHNDVDIITHPGHRMDIDTLALARACAETNTALEINTSHRHITPEFIEVAAKQGAQFVIGSDAHTPERVADFDWGITLARQVGLTSEQIRNAREVK